MKYLIFIFLIILFYNSQAQLDDVVISVQNISDSCNYGEQIIFRDTNKDSVYDFIRRSFCDFSNKDDSLLVIGDGEILSGMKGELLEGDFQSNYFKIKIIDPFTETTYAYIEYDSFNNVAVLRFIPTAIELPVQNELELFPNPTHNYIQFENSFLTDISQIKVYSELGNEIELPKAVVNGNNVQLDVSSLQEGVYFMNVFIGDRVEMVKFVKIEN